MRRRAPDTRAALVVAGWGDNQQVFADLVAHYNLGRSLDVFHGLSQPELNVLLNQARTSVLFSRKEGSNKTLFESMFAGTPALLLENNRGANRDHFNSDTGFLFSEQTFPDSILRFRDPAYSASFSPRDWAMTHISPEVTTSKIIRSLQSAHGAAHLNPAPLFLKVNSPEATYMNPEDSNRVPPIGKVIRAFLKSDAGTVDAQSRDSCIRQLFS
jgi:glycosyltransferase involved in cell wall biosynthesis